MGKPTLEERFWAKVRKTETCWVWTASTTVGGYGQFGVNRRPKRAHRVSYEMANGLIPEGMEIDHICHNTACVRPDHLRLATRKQNKEYLAGPSRRNGHSRVRGVSPNGSGWRVQVGHNGKVLYFGTYSTIAEAEQVAIRERARLFSFPEAQASQVVR